LKKRKPAQTPAPFMNKTLRKEIYKKRMLHNKFWKNRSKVIWENYRKQRNHVNRVITESAVKVCSILAVTRFVGKYNIN
jgi:hypothetical protein